MSLAGHPEHALPIRPHEHQPAALAHVRAGVADPAQGADNGVASDPAVAVDRGQPVHHRSGTGTGQSWNRQPLAPPRLHRGVTAVPAEPAPRNDRRHDRTGHDDHPRCARATVEVVMDASTACSKALDHAYARRRMCATRWCPRTELDLMHTMRPGRPGSICRSNAGKPTALDRGAGSSLYV